MLAHDGLLHVLCGTGLGNWFWMILVMKINEKHVYKTKRVPQFHQHFLNEQTKTSVCINRCH